MGNGTIVISAVINRQRCKRTYIGYTYEQTVKKFNDEFGIDPKTEANINQE